MAPKNKCPIDNGIYDRYGERWYTAEDDPVALLRAEARARNAWIISEIARRASGPVRVLDIGCGAGFLTNELVMGDFRVTGVDTSAPALEVARQHDATGRVGYCCGDASSLAFRTASFDAVCAMDFLEHVDDPGRVVREAARALKQHGLFFFYTFNRNFMSWLIVIKGVEWFIRNTPPNMHCLQSFIKPAELKRICRENGLEVIECRGFAPKVFSRAFWKMLATGRIDDRFSFRFTRHTLIGYIGLAIKKMPDTNFPPALPGKPSLHQMHRSRAAKTDCGQ